MSYFLRNQLLRYCASTRKMDVGRCTLLLVSCCVSLWCLAWLGWCAFVGTWATKQFTEECIATARGAAPAPLQGWEWTSTVIRGTEAVCFVVWWVATIQQVVTHKHLLFQRFLFGGLVFPEIYDFTSGVIVVFILCGVGIGYGAERVFGCMHFKGLVMMRCQKAWLHCMKRYGIAGC
eukprot:TRINITY_DN48606_c0_g1_i1.p1 TRINITY_DN48606_c0_g1~~TRINITY_DN48606_c0_g1_i1.p1  ORF type:complete len:177 (+),score=1.96 TRINITY_DN48606_c0_g1_i1:51-581(+)